MPHKKTVAKEEHAKEFYQRGRVHSRLRPQTRSPNGQAKNPQPKKPVDPSKPKKPRKHGANRVYTDEQIIEVLYATGGAVYTTALRLGVSHVCIYYRIKQSEAIRAALVAARGMMVDHAESKLLKAVKRGDPWSIRFALLTQGKDRGYVERHEHRVGGDADAPPVAIKTETVDVSKLSLELRLRLLEELEKIGAETTAVPALPPVAEVPPTEGENGTPIVQ